MDTEKNTITMVLDKYGCYAKKSYDRGSIVVFLKESNKQIGEFKMSGNPYTFPGNYEIANREIARMLRDYRKTNK